MSYQLHPEFGLGSPAAIDLADCSRILIDPVLWLFIPRAQKRFIIEHELAHCREGADTELQADAIAFEAFVAAGGDPQDAYHAIVDNLNLSLPENEARAKQISQQIEMMYLKTPAKKSEMKYFAGPPTAGYNYSQDTDMPSQASDPNRALDADDWMNLFNRALEGAPDIIRAAKGQGSLYTPPGSINGQLPPPKNNTLPIVLLGGGLLLFVGILLLVK